MSKKLTALAIVLTIIFGAASAGAQELPSVSGAANISKLEGARLVPSLTLAVEGVNLNASSIGSDDSVGVLTGVSVRAGLALESELGYADLSLGLGASSNYSQGRSGLNELIGLDVSTALAPSASIIKLADDRRLMAAFTGGFRMTRWGWNRGPEYEIVPFGGVSVLLKF